MPSSACTHTTHAALVSDHLILSLVIAESEDVELSFLRFVEANNRAHCGSASVPKSVGS